MPRPAAFARLGYPTYLLHILGLAKVLGAVAIVSKRSKTLEEWAYAGYTFNLLGAIASHLFVSDVGGAIAPGSVLPFVLISYWPGRRLSPSPVAA